MMITRLTRLNSYEVPFVCFINKCDRPGAKPLRIIEQIRYSETTATITVYVARLLLPHRSKLRTNAAAVQLPIGLESNLRGVVDLITQEALYLSLIHI